MAATERRTAATMPGKPGFRSRQEIEARHWQGRRRARRPMPHGKSLLLTGVVVLVLVSAGFLAAWSLVVTMTGGDSLFSGSGNAAQAPDSDDPFAGTPAANFPQGAEGIVLPQATALGTWTPEQVQDVLARTKRTLVAARLDPALVELGNPGAYLASISEGARTTVA